MLWAEERCVKLGEECRLRVFDNRMPGLIFGYKKLEKAA